MAITRRYRLPGVAAGNFHRILVLLVIRAIPQSPIQRAPPTPQHLTASLHRTGVVSTGRNRAERGVPVCSTCRLMDSFRHARVTPSASARLILKGISPAVAAAVRIDCARVEPARTHLKNLFVPVVASGVRIMHPSRRELVILVRDVIADLIQVVHTPAVEPTTGSTRRDAAGMATTTIDRRKRDPARYHHRSGRIGRRTVTQLPVIVISPTHGDIIGANTTYVTRTGRNHPPGMVPCHLHRKVAVVSCATTHLPVATAPPAVASAVTGNTACGTTLRVRPDRNKILWPVRSRVCRVLDRLWNGGFGGRIGLIDPQHVRPAPAVDIACSASYHRGFRATDKVAVKLHQQHDSA